MLTSWTIRNFKSARKETLVPLRPLTVLAGANSSGKSTIIQSMLLLQQTTQHPVQSKALVLNGKYIRMGSFSEVLSSHATENFFVLGFEYESDPSGAALHSPSKLPQNPRELESPIVKIGCRISFTHSPSLQGEVPELSALQAAVLNARIFSQRTDGSEEAVEIRRSGNPDGKIAKARLDKALITADEAMMLHFDVVTPSRVSLPSSYLEGDEYAKSPVGAKLNHCLPVGLAVTYDRKTHAANMLVDSVMRRRVMRPSNRAIPNSLVRKLQELAEEYEREALLAKASAPASALRRVATFRALLKSIESGTVSATASELARGVSVTNLEFRVWLESKRDVLVKCVKVAGPEELAIATTVSPAEEIETRLREVISDRIKYLGPLRDEPRPYYPLEGSSDPTDVGIKGEFTAAVLHLNKSRFVSAISPVDFARDRSRATATRKTLHQAVVDWLHYMELVSNVETQDKGVFGHEMRVSTSDAPTKHTLVHVGVGVSQVLPILVMSLIAPRGSVLLFEQPELHLHPRVQARLADFFLSIAQNGTQCILETHSEYMINRVRLRVAEDTENRTMDLVRLINVEKINGDSTYRSVALNSYGNIEDWPAGFFDHLPNEAEEILRAALKKRGLVKKTSS